MLIVLEGLEGVGKTTLGVAVAERLNIPYLKSPPSEFNPIRGLITEHSEPKVRFYFYLSGLYALQPRIRDANSVKSAIIVDRYILSTIAYCYSGHSFETPTFNRGDLIRADLTINVTCDEHIRQERIQARGLHIYARPKVNEEAISTFIAAQSDENFVNCGPLDQEISRLSSQIAKRLFENEQAL